MIGFGELRKLSLQWQTDLAAVERVLVIGWLLKGIFDREVLREGLALRGAAALGKAYFADYPPVEEVDFVSGAGLDDLEFGNELERAVEDAARNSGLILKLNSIQGNAARLEYAGPLGRRSAAQPHFPLRFHVTPLRAHAVQRSMLHPFSDHCEAAVHAVSLEEMAAERIAVIAQRPRARDVFDLWFILRHGGEQLNRAATRAMVQQIAGEKGGVVGAGFDPAYRPLLERAWENALKLIPYKPSFAQAEAEIGESCVKILYERYEGG